MEDIEEKRNILWYVGLVSYLLALTVITIVVSFLQRKIRVKYRFDTLPIFIVIYFINFIVIQHVFGLNWGYLVGCCLFMLVLLRLFGRFQIVGLTGGLGCGKSTVSNFFKSELKFKVVDCDEISREIVQVGEPAYHAVVRAFGKEIINPDTKEIDRRALSAIVFGDPAKRRRLNRIMAKPLTFRILKHLFRHFRNGESMAILDAPLLFESKYLPWICYPIITIYVTSEQEQIRRVCKRDNRPREEVEAIIKAQMPLSYKIAHADIRINNDSDTQELKKKVITDLTPFVL